MFCSHNGLQFPTRPSRKKCLKRDGLCGRIYGLMHTASSLYMHGPRLGNPMLLRAGDLTEAGAMKTGRAQLLHFP